MDEEPRKRLQSEIMDERLSWDNMVNQYPNQWIAIRDPIIEGADVVSGVIVAVISDEEICEYENNHLREELLFRRTNLGSWSGMIESTLSLDIV